MCRHAAKDERRQEGEGHDEGVEETVVAFPNTVPHPGAVMVEPLCKIKKMFLESRRTVSINLPEHTL